MRRVRQGSESASQQAATGSGTRGVNVPRETVEHQRGAKNCYCARCRVIRRRSTKLWKLRVGRGEPVWGDIEAVRAHVTWLGQLGMGMRAVAVAAGVSPTAVSHLFYDFNRQRRTERITYRVAQKLLRVRFDIRAIAATAPSTKVDSSRARRSLQALVVAGWTVPLLAERVGMERQQLRRYFYLPVYAAKTCVRFLDLFQELWPQEPPRISAYAEARRRTMVAENGWVGIGAWDDDTIDDPDAVPNLHGDDESTVDAVRMARVLDGREKFKVLNHVERIELVRRWDEEGRSKTAFEKRFSVSTQTSGKYFELAVPDYQRKSA
jgi:AcrR family transcriptional regulator